MSEMTPYTAWVLMPSFKPAQVELVHQYPGQGWSRGPATHHGTSAGKYYSLSEIHATKADAIAAGRAKLEEMQAKINKTLAGIAKKRAKLDEAAAAGDAA
jgi:hypothetical protein